MGGLHHSVTAAFAVSGSVIKEKGYFVIKDKTRSGKKMIRRTKDTSEQISARHQILEHCHKAGYPWLDKYYLSNNGQPYVSHDGDNYIMTDLLNYPETDFADQQGFLKLVEALARWHSCARGIKLGSALNKGRPPAPLSESFTSQEEFLTSLRKRVSKQSKWSDFDVLFLKNFAEYKNRMQKAQNLLNSTNYLTRWQKAAKQSHICHGGLKEDTMLVFEDKFYLTKFDQASIGYQLNDLCDLIRRREKGHGKQDCSLILEAYSNVLPLEADEELIAEAMLLYPFAFIKIVKEYYQKKRSWTPVAMTNKMLEVLCTP